MLQENLYESGTQGQIKSMMSQFGPKTEKFLYAKTVWQWIKIVVTEFYFESRDFYMELPGLHFANYFKNYLYLFHGIFKTDGLFLLY